MTISRVTKKSEYRRLRFPIEYFLVIFNRRNSVEYAGGLIVPNKIQPQEYSRGGGIDGILHIFGKLCYLILNRNGDSPNVNVNRDNLDNNWNENVRFLLVREYLLFTPPYLGGVSFACCFSQPPSILPASTNGLEIIANCLLSKAFNSQASCVKYFRVSSLMLDFWIKVDLYSLAVNPAVSISSITSQNRTFIFSAKEYFTSFGRWGR